MHIFQVFKLGKGKNIVIWVLPCMFPPFLCWFITKNDARKTVFDGYLIALFLRSFIELYIGFLRCAASAKYGRTTWLVHQRSIKISGKGHVEVME
ncbi:MAG: hypothetical protein NXY57DRAFT_280587 [Lentinula lateritia]|nr:MAG: hypothetical protein NXY57DRAFT_280587 [Lentinula lateritia]